MHDICKFSINAVFVYIIAFKSKDILQEDKTGVKSKKNMCSVPNTTTRLFCNFTCGVLCHVIQEEVLFWFCEVPPIQW